MKPRTIDQYRFWGLHPVTGDWEFINTIDWSFRNITFYDGDVFSFKDVKPRMELGFGDDRHKPLREGDVLFGRRWQYPRVLAYHHGQFHLSRNTRKSGSRLLVTPETVMQYALTKVGTIDEHPDDWARLTREGAWEWQSPPQNSQK